MEMDDVQVGQFLTVLSWKKPFVPLGMREDGPIPIMVMAPKDGLVGDVFKIKAVDLPFAVIEVMSGNHAGVTGKLDLREVRLKKLKPEYVKAMTQQPKLPSSRQEPPESLTSFLNMLGSLPHQREEPPPYGLPGPGLDRTKRKKKRGKPR